MKKMLQFCVSGLIKRESFSRAMDGTEDFLSVEL